MYKKISKAFPAVIRRGIFSWLTAAVFVRLPLLGAERELDGVEGLAAMSFPGLVLSMAAVFILLSLLTYRSRRMVERIERCGIPAAFGILGILTLISSFSVPYLCAVLLTEALLAVYAVRGADRTETVRDEGGHCISGNRAGDSGREERAHIRKDKRRQRIHRRKTYPSAAWTDGGKACPSATSIDGGKTRPSAAWTDGGKARPSAAWIAGGLALLFFGFVSVWTVSRVLTYSSPSYDFGIFSQMFYRMRATGLADTTLERDGLLSHFQVHVSLIYYLLLPFYCLYPKPVTLQILQAAILASAVVPAWKLTQRLGCGYAERVFLCLMLFLYPAYAGGTSYDIHENAFLTPLLLWVFYMVEARKGWGLAVFGVMTCMVKEDAPVYLAVIALWLVSRSLLGEGETQSWGVKAGIGLFIGAVIWFLAATGYLARYGDGVMTNRYSNFIYDGSGSLLAVIKAVFLSPMKALYECVDAEKLAFIGLTMAPLCGIPLITRKYERFLLLIPYVLVNLMSDYQYQHNIFFQYTYGSTACLFYLTAVNYRDLSSRIKRRFFRYMPLFLAVVVAGACFGAVVVPKAVKYPVRYKENREHYREIARTLEKIPEDASVTASTFYTVPLSGRDVLYDVRYASEEHLLGTDYVVLSMHDENSYKKYAGEDETGYDSVVNLLEENGFRLTDCVEDTLTVYKKEML